MITAAEVKSHAHALGFDLVGITTANSLHPHDKYLEQWLAAGMHGEMAYMADHAGTAADPRRVVPGARSVVVVGLSYRWDADKPDARVPRGQISAYAWGT